MFYIKIRFMNVKRIGVLLAIILLTMSVKAQNIAGDWKGTLSVQGIDLELVFHLAREDGSLTGTMDVPMQGAAGIPVDVIELTGNEVKLGVTAAQIVYTASCREIASRGTTNRPGWPSPSP